MASSWRRRFATKRTLARLLAVMVGAGLGSALANWDMPDWYAGMDVIDFTPRCR